MNARKGYYSLIQYCPDLTRLEAATVGVVLFCPDAHFIRARTASSNQRIRRFFGSQDCDWQQINAVKAAIEERLEAEGEQFRKLEDFEQFAATRANEIQLTAPRPMKVFHPEQDLELLFRRVVGGTARAHTTPTVVQRLTETLSDETLISFVRRNVPVTVRAFHQTLTVPFAFQNGRLNLIQPASFAQFSSSRAISRACRLAVEGHSLYQHPDDTLGGMQLFVVSDFSVSQLQVQGIVREIFTENDVRLFSATDLPQLVHEIRTTGKPLAKPEA